MGEIVFRFRPEHPAAGSGIFFRVSRKLDQFLNVGTNLGFVFPCEGQLFVEEGRVQAKVHFDMSALFAGAFVKFLAVNYELHQCGHERPLPATLVGRPKVPVSLKNISEIIMDMVGGDHQCFFRADGGGKALFQQRRFIPRYRMQGQIIDPRPLRRKRKLLEHGENVRQHLRAGEAGEPQT